MRCLATISFVLLTSVPVLAGPQVNADPPLVVMSDVGTKLDSLQVEQLKFSDEYRNALRLAESQRVDEAIAILEKCADECQGAERGFYFYRLGFFNIKRGDYRRAHYEFARVRTSLNYAPEDCIADARMRLGFLEVREKNYDQALAYFQEVAGGKVRATPLQVTDAGMRSAFVLRALKRPEDAVGVLEALYASSPEKDDRDYALLLAAATLWEAGKGDYNPTLQLDERKSLFSKSIALARKLCDDSSVRPEIQCVAELIHFEDYYFLGEYETAIPMAEAFIEKWSTELDRGYRKVTQGKTWAIEEFPRRHLITAEAWLMIMYYRTKDYESALKVAKNISGGTWKAEDPYKNFNVFGYARVHEQLALERLGKSPDAKAAESVGREMWPDWYAETLDRMRREGDSNQPVPDATKFDQLPKLN